METAWNIFSPRFQQNGCIGNVVPTSVIESAGPDPVRLGDLPLSGLPSVNRFPFNALNPLQSSILHGNSGLPTDPLASLKLCSLAAAASDVNANGLQLRENFPSASAPKSFKPKVLCMNKTPPRQKLSESCADITAKDYCQNKDKKIWNPFQSPKESNKNTSSENSPVAKDCGHSVSVTASSGLDTVLISSGADKMSFLGNPGMPERGCSDSEVRRNAQPYPSGEQGPFGASHYGTGQQMAGMFGGNPAYNNQMQMGYPFPVQHDHAAFNKRFNPSHPPQNFPPFMNSQQQSMGHHSASYPSGQAVENHLHQNDSFPNVSGGRMFPPNANSSSSNPPSHPLSHPPNHPQSNPHPSSNAQFMGSNSFSSHYTPPSKAPGNGHHTLTSENTSLMQASKPAMISPAPNQTPFNNNTPVSDQTSSSFPASVSRPGSGNHVSGNFSPMQPTSSEIAMTTEATIACMTTSTSCSQLDQKQNTQQQPSPLVTTANLAMNSGSHSMSNLNLTSSVAMATDIKSSPLVPQDSASASDQLLSANQQCQSDLNTDNRITSKFDDAKSTLDAVKGDSPNSNDKSKQLNKQREEISSDNVENEQGNLQSQSEATGFNGQKTDTEQNRLQQRTLGTNSGYENEPQMKENDGNCNQTTQQNLVSSHGDDPSPVADVNQQFVSAENDNGNLALTSNFTQSEQVVAANSINSCVSISTNTVNPESFKTSAKNMDCPPMPICREANIAVKTRNEEDTDNQTEKNDVTATEPANLQSFTGSLDRANGRRVNTPIMDQNSQSSMDSVQSCSRSAIGTPDIKPHMKEEPVNMGAPVSQGSYPTLNVTDNDMSNLYMNFGSFFEGDMGLCFDTNAVTAKFCGSPKQETAESSDEPKTFLDLDAKPVNKKESAKRQKISQDHHMHQQYHPNMHPGQMNPGMNGGYGWPYSREQKFNPQMDGHFQGSVPYGQMNKGQDHQNPNFPNAYNSGYPGNMGEMSKPQSGDMQINSMGGYHGNGYSRDGNPLTQGMGYGQYSGNQENAMRPGPGMYGGNMPGHMQGTGDLQMNPGFMGNNQPSQDSFAGGPGNFPQQRNGHMGGYRPMGDQGQGFHSFPGGQNFHPNMPMGATSIRHPSSQASPIQQLQGMNFNPDLNPAGSPVPTMNQTQPQQTSTKPKKSKKGKKRKADADIENSEGANLPPLPFVQISPSVGALICENESGEGEPVLRFQDSKVETIFDFSLEGLSPIACQFLQIEQRLCRKILPIKFRHPVSVIYNPLIYAFQTHRNFVAKFCTTQRPILFLGMNPGPYGMSQNGIPFGEVGVVREWLKITGNVYKPEREHPKRAVYGLTCTRNEVSGSRFWGLFQKICQGPESFFQHCFVTNLCPQAFMTECGKNITPPQLPSDELNQLNDACDEALLEIVRLLNVRLVIAVGKFVQTRAAKALKDNGISDIAVETIMHPSPINPTANRSWEPIVAKQLQDMGAMQYLCTDPNLIPVQPPDMPL